MDLVGDSFNIFLYMKFCGIYPFNFTVKYQSLYFTSFKRSNCFSDYHNKLIFIWHSLFFHCRPLIVQLLSSSNPFVFAFNFMSPLMLPQTGKCKKGFFTLKTPQVLVIISTVINYTDTQTIQLKYRVCLLRWR